MNQPTSDEELLAILLELNNASVLGRDMAIHVAMNKLKARDAAIRIDELEKLPWTGMTIGGDNVDMIIRSQIDKRIAELRRKSDQVKEEE